MRTTALLLPFVVLLATACDEANREDPAPAPPAAPREMILRDVPVFRPSLPGDTTGTDEVERRTYVTNASPDSLVRFYEARLPEAGWRVVGRNADLESRHLHASDSLGRSLWVEIRVRTPGMTGFTLIARAAGPATAGDTLR